MRKAITSSGATSVGPYSHGVDADGLIFLSGQTPIDPATGSLVSGGVEAQTRQCFSNLRAVLESGGLSMDNVQKVNVYMTDLTGFAAMNEVYRQEFSEPYPARTTVGVASLPLGAEVEIELIARR